MTRGSRKLCGRAQREDRYTLYERSVQEPDADISLINRIYKKHFDRPPRLLREDFCGTALLACRWAARHTENHAWGIDLDPEPLEWGRRHNVAKLRPNQAARVKLIEGNVLDVGHEKVDVTAAFNFSYFTFESRQALRHYFEQARATLGPEGLLMLDAYGGADSQRTGREPRRVDGFTYVWDQHRFDPITHSVTNFIHFEFKDGSRMPRAFRYDWRLWTLPEIQEILVEAGFRSTTVYWEGTDRKTGEANGVFSPREQAPDDPAWVAYITALP
jgi:hypothetical protein